MQSAVLTCDLTVTPKIFQVKDGVLYNQKHTRQGAVRKIFMSWVLAFLLYGPAIIGFNHWRGNSTVEEDDCDTEFATDFWYTLVTAIIEFLVPVILLLVFNVYIFWKIRQRALEKLHKEKKLRGVSSGKGHEAGFTNQAFAVSPSLQAIDKDCGTASDQNQQTLNNGRALSTVDVEVDVAAGSKNGGLGENEPKAKSGAMSNSVVTVSEENKILSMAERNMRRYRKAARSLALLVIVFSVCWLPYTVSTLILAVCETCVNKDLYEAFNWLLWLNSSINPFLYAVMNPLFRRHYQRLLCRWHAGGQRNHLAKEYSGSGGSVQNSRY